MNPMSKFEWPTEENPIYIHHGCCIKLMQRLPNECIDATICDPPYGIGFSSMQRTEKIEGFDKIENDERPYIWFLNDTARILKPGGVLVCFCRWDVQEAFRLAIGWAGLKVICQLVWDRGVHGMGDLTGAPGPQHDVMWLASKGKYLLPAKRPTTVYNHQRVDGKKMVHPTEKPVPLMRHLIRDYTEWGDLIWEPFGGSGSTGIAALHEGRRCVMSELNEGFVTIQRQRVAEFYGTGCLFPAKPAGKRPKGTVDNNTLI